MWFSQEEIATVFHLIYLIAITCLCNVVFSANILQGITDEQSGLFEELKLLETEASSQLQEEESKRSTLLQVLEGAALKTEFSLLKDNQQLVLQLQQTEEKVKVCLCSICFMCVCDWYRQSVADTDKVNWALAFNLTDFFLTNINHFIKISVLSSLE